ncbi:MAG: hypothetical protein HZB41_01740 [Ignavibacteriae bacterium]|nr:hypothetical protein [Ignavibacteriota bacterium]
MSRILLSENNSWFDELKIISNYPESHFENEIMRFSKDVFYDYHTLPFKQELSAQDIDKPARPDLILIKKDYQEWWFVEVELYKKNWDHTFFQINVFANAEINKFLIKNYLMRIAQQFDIPLIEESLLIMLDEIKQKVLVIVDEEIDEEKEKKVKELGAKLCYFELYRNTNDENAYRLFGEYPINYESESHLTNEGGQLKLLNENILNLNEGNIKINYNDRISTWILKKKRGKYFLECYGMNPLSTDKVYILIKDSKGKYHFKLN